MSWTWFAGAVFLLLFCFVAYDGWKILRARSLASGIIAKSRPFERNDETRAKTILVLGDSTAVGVGSSPEQSVPGRMSAWLDANVENYAKSGARAVDLAAQLSRAKHSRYDFVLIQIGANDVIHFALLDKANANLASALRQAKTLSDRVVVLTAGNIGSAPVFGFPLNWVISARTRALRERFMATTEREGAIYIDIYARPDPFASEPEKYYAPDGLHLTGEGYRFWFSIVKEYVQKKWPEIAE